MVKKFSKWKRLSRWVRCPEKLKFMYEQFEQFEPNSKGVLWKLVIKRNKVAFYARERTK